VRGSRSCRAPARLAGGGEPPVVPRQRRGTPEEEVAIAPARDVPPHLLERVELRRVVPALAVQDILLVEVHAWPVDRVFDRQAVADDIDYDLEHGAAQPQRARTADDEVRRAAAQHERRAHPGRETLAGP